MELILSGNPNLKTIKNVLFLVTKTYQEKGEINKVLFIDYDGSNEKDGVSIEGERNKLVRKFIGVNTRIESVILSSASLAGCVPKLISEELKVYKQEQIIVDLTNGTKQISNILYASASLSRIKNLFFLYVPRDYQDKEPEELDKQEYSIIPISPMDNLDTIGRYSFFEILYYREQLEELAEQFKTLKHISRNLRDQFAYHTEIATNNYFSGKYDKAITSLGYVAEEIIKMLCYRLKDLGGLEMNVRGFSYQVTWLRDQFGKKVREHQGRKLKPYEETYKMLSNVDITLDLIRVYRNIHSHPNDYSKEKMDAQMIINNFVHLADLIIRSKIFE